MGTISSENDDTRDNAYGPKSIWHFHMHDIDVLSNVKGS